MIFWKAKHVFVKYVKWICFYGCMKCVGKLICKNINVELFKCLIFNQDTLEMCSKENEFKSILFSLCYFHACIVERRKFGPQGWNRPYPFNTCDLTISVNVLYNYLEANSKVCPNWLKWLSVIDYILYIYFYFRFLGLISVTCLER